MSMASTLEMDVKKAVRRVAKATGKKTGQEETPVKLGLYLSREVDKRLRIHCTMWDRTISDVVAELIESHLRDFVVHRSRSAQEGVSSPQSPELDWPPGESGKTG